MNTANTDLYHRASNLTLVTHFAFFVYANVNEARDLALQGLKYGKPDYIYVNLTWSVVL